jgi:hypothetical protein
MQNHHFVTLYFVPMVLCGAYILLNLVLAVIVSKFRESNQDYRAKITVENLAEYEFLIARWAMSRYYIHTHTVLTLYALSHYTHYTHYSTIAL